MSEEDKGVKPAEAALATLRQLEKSDYSEERKAFGAVHGLITKLVALRIATAAIDYSSEVEGTLKVGIFKEWHAQYGGEFLDPTYAAAAKTAAENFRIITDDTDYKDELGPLVQTLEKLAPQPVVPVNAGST